MAVYFSRKTMGWVSFIIFLLSIPIFAGGMWLRSHASVGCVRHIDERLILVGMALMFTSFMGIGYICNRTFNITCFVVRVNAVLLIAAIFGVLTGLALAYTIPAFAAGAGEVVRGRGYTEYKLREGSNWLQDMVKDPNKWVNIKSCLLEQDVCRDFAAGSTSFSSFLLQDLSPTQSGCCKPPVECGFIFRGPMEWEIPAMGALSNSSDCSTWSNNRTALCYDCHSCMAGVIVKLKMDWNKVAITSTVFVSLLCIFCPLFCFMFYRSVNEFDDPPPPAPGFYMDGTQIVFYTS